MKIRKRRKTQLPNKHIYSFYGNGTNTLLTFLKKYPNVVSIIVIEKPTDDVKQKIKLCKNNLVVILQIKSSFQAVVIKEHNGKVIQLGNCRNSIKLELIDFALLYANDNHLITQVNTILNKHV